MTDQIKPMTQDRIRELIEAYGAAPGKMAWPGTRPGYGVYCDIGRGSGSP